MPSRADEGFYPIKADDGTIIANHRVPNTLESQIEKLPGVIVVGNPHGDVTLNEFYDVNCPDLPQGLGRHRRAAEQPTAELRLVLVPFPVLSVASIQGTRVELAVARLTSAQNFYKFHRMLDQSRGMVDGNRAMAAAQAIGLDPAKLLKIANDDAVAKIMIAHVKLGDALAIKATPGLVIKGVAIVGYPGPKALARIIDSVERCDAVICGKAALGRARFTLSLAAAVRRDARDGLGERLGRHHHMMRVGVHQRFARRARSPRGLSRTPGRRVAGPRARPACRAPASCMSLSRGQATPAACSATCTSPEQSMPERGLAAPQIGRAQEGFRHRDEIRRLGGKRRQMHLRNMPAGRRDGEAPVLPRDAQPLRPSAARRAAAA